MDDSIHEYVQKIINLYSSYKDEEFAEWSKTYLRNQFKFLGIRSPIRRKITKEFLKEHGLPKKEHFQAVIQLLWELSEREYQKAALDLLEKGKKQLTEEDMPWLTSLIVKKSWWDTIDELAPKIFGYKFSTYEHLIPMYADKWIEDENIWLQRSAILYQLKYKEKMNEERLFRYILRQADSNEFFVQKAIGWILREYAKTKPERVKDFVVNHDLKPLSKREALKHL